MHPAAFSFMSDTILRRNLDGGDILDLGGRDVNGSIRCLFPRAAAYICVDIESHPSVDVVCDAADLALEDRFDVVVSTECFEHTPRADAIVGSAYRHLRPGGVFVATMAGPGREPHGAAGGPVGSEFYRNVTTEDLEEWLEGAGFADWSIDVSGADVRCVAERGV